MGAHEIAQEGGALGKLARLASEHDAPHIAVEALALARRTAEGRFFVACVGQFKRGKSTLLNALLDDSVLPVGVLPVTAVVTVVRHGAERSAVIRMADGRSVKAPVESLADYVAEERNPGNAKGVSAVEVTLPSPILRGGLCLVDTPGIGSVFAGNTEATRAFVPHIDAALVVLGADPPISGDELALVEEVGKHVAHLLCVLNKADRLPPAERQEAARFAQRVLAERLSRPVGPLLEVCATERLAGGAPTRDWEHLERALRDLSERSGSQLVEAAQRRGLKRLAAALRHELEERYAALERPIEESEARLAALEQTVAAAQRSMADLGVLLTAEQQRLARISEERLSDFLRSVPRLEAELLRDLPETRSEALEKAGQFARAQVEAWHQKTAPVAEHLYAEAMDRFVTLANDFLTRTSGVPAAPLDAESGFRVPPRAFFTEMLALTGRSPPRWLADLVLGRRALRRDAASYVSRLLEVNAHRVASDLNERVRESRNKLELEIRTRLREVVAVSQRALEAARRSRAAGEPAVNAELARLQDALLSLEALSG